MQNENIYALICVSDTGAGHREQTQILEKDAAEMFNALTEGLRVNGENIRITGAQSCGDEPVGSRGIRRITASTLTGVQFARALSGYRRQLEEDDIFLFYYTGHGNDASIVLSDTAIRMRDLTAVIDAFHCKAKLLILDSCQSGSADPGTAKQMDYEGSFQDFTGSGTAIMASSAPDGSSWSNPGNGMSVYTGIVCAAMRSRQRVRKGMLSLMDLQRETAVLMGWWNRHCPEKAQHPFFRESMGGTIRFHVEDFRPYNKKTLFLESDSFCIREVKPIDTVRERRLAVFVTARKAEGNESLAEITKKVILLTRDAAVYENARMEEIQKGRSPDSIWVYFGADRTDILRHNHYACTIWAGRAELKKKYYREGGSFSLYDGIYIFRNNSYEAVRQLQAPPGSESTGLNPEENLTMRKLWISRMVTLAEQLLSSINAVENGEYSYDSLQSKYRPWVREVTQLYHSLESQDSFPDGLYAWAEAVSQTAGCIMDLALLLQPGYRDDADPAGVPWLLRAKTDAYHASLESAAAEERKVSKCRHDGDHFSSGV